MSANLDWLKKAENSENPEIQELLINYKTAETQELQKEMELAIKQAIVDEAEEKANEKPQKPIVEIEVQQINKEEQAPEIVKPEHKDFTLTLKDIEEAKIEDLGNLISVCREEIKYIKDNSPKKMDRKEKLTSLGRTNFITHLIQTAQRRIYDERREKKMEENKIKGNISSVKLKQLRLIRLLSQGISFTQIVRDPTDGLKVEDLVACMEKDDTIFEQFPPLRHRWNVWKEKRLQKTEKGYKLRLY